MAEELHVTDLLPAYALGSLGAEETRRVDEHLANCLICRGELKSFESVADQLSLAASLNTPSPDLKDRLMQRVQATRPQSRAEVQMPARPWFERLLPAWGLASLLLVLALAGSNLFLWQRMNQVEFLTSPGRMRAVPLTATEQGSPATGFVLISASGDEGALVVDGLPPLAENQQYQLWLIRDGKRTSGAVFSTDEKSYGGTRIRAPRPLLDYSSVGITIEPTGGSPQPTGKKVLGGPLFNP